MRKIQPRRSTRLQELKMRCWSLRLRGLSQVEISEQLNVSQSTVSRALRRAEATATASAEPRIGEWRAVALARLEDSLKAAWSEFAASGEKGSRGSRWLALAVEIGRQIRRLQGLEDSALPVMPDLPEQQRYRRRVVLSALSDQALEALYTALGRPPEPDPGSRCQDRVLMSTDHRKRLSPVDRVGCPAGQVVSSTSSSFSRRPSSPALRLSLSR